MKNECIIVKDLLPLYIENLISDETRAFMDEHLASCDDCRKLLERNQTSPMIKGDADTVPLKIVKKQLKQQKLKSVLLSVVLVMAILISGFGYLTAPQFVPYSEDVLSVSEKEDGTIIISFTKDKVTGFDINDLVRSDDGNEIMFINGWKTTWDLFISNREPGDIIISGEDGASIGAIFYSPNTDEEAIQVFGDDVNYHVIELPRLALVYYLLIAGLAVILGGALLLLFRKNSKAKIWIERIALFPAAYILSHIITKGFVTTSYSMERDLGFILLIAILIYAGGLLGLSLYRSNRDLKLPDQLE